MSRAMSPAQLRVASAGPLVSVQDRGRAGLMRYGVPASGPMDRQSFAIANAALRNPESAAGIEVSLGGLTLECLAGAVLLAVAGGGFVVEAGGARGGSWQVLRLKAGQRLVIRPGPWGSWTYIGFAGRLRLPEWLGSHATHAASNLGGGRLTAGQILTIDTDDAHAAATGARSGPLPCPVWARPRRILHCVLGPQQRFFPAEALAAFSATPYTLTDACDRMGARLRGPALVPEGALGIPSEPILRGAVQVSGEGVPTVLLADHQTTGGYPKIATLLACDVDGFVQNRPRDRIRFAPVLPEAAVAIARTRAAAARAYFAALRSAGPAAP